VAWTDWGGRRWNANLHTTLRTLGEDWTGGRGWVKKRRNAKRTGGGEHDAWTRATFGVFPTLAGGVWVFS